MLSSYTVAVYGLTWRNTSSWCNSKRDTGTTVEHGIKLAATESNCEDISGVQKYWTWSAGLIQVDADYKFSVCGCRQSMFKAKRREQRYKAWHANCKLTCPRNVTKINGFSAGLM